jgi:hypothetical protein
MFPEDRGPIVQPTLRAISRVAAPIARHQHDPGALAFTVLALGRTRQTLKFSTFPAGQYNRLLLGCSSCP